MEYDHAIAEFDQAITHDSEFIWPVVCRALTESRAGAHDLARRDLSKATDRFPGCFESHWARAWFLATCPDPRFRDGPLALTEATLAVELSGEDLYALDALAAAYAETGNFEKAQELETQVIAQLPKSDPDNKRMEDRLALYRDYRPYRSH